MRHDQIVAQTIVFLIGWGARARLLFALARHGKLRENVARFLTIPTFVVYGMRM